MRNILCIILLFAVTRNLTLGQGYYSDRMYDASGSFRKTAHTYSSGFTRSEYTKIDEMIDAVVEKVKSVYPEPVGVDPGLELATPKIFGHNDFSLNPSISASAKGQLFLTFEGSNLVDGGFLWEAEVDLKGLRKPELKQNFTFAVNKGFTYEGALTDIGDKIFGFPPETQINKNINIYKPPH